MNLQNLLYILSFSLPISRALISFLVILIPLIWLKNEKNIYNKISQNKITIIIFLFLLYYLLTFFWTQNNTYEAFKFIRYILYWGIFFVLATYLKLQINKILSFFLLGMFISEIIAYGVYFDLWKFKNATSFNPSPFMFWIDYSIFLAFTALILLNKLLIKKYTIKKKIFFIVYFFMVCGNLFLIIGRTGQIAFLFSILVIFTLNYKNRIKAIVLSILLIFSIFIIAYENSQSFQIRVKQTTLDLQNIYNKNLNNSWGIRIAYWIVSYNIFQKYPIFGVGLGDYQSAIIDELKNKKYNFLNKETKDFMSRFHPHNQYLLILLQSGILGLGIFIYILFLLFKLEIKNKEIKNLSVVFFTIYCIGFMTEPLLTKQFTLVLFIFFTGLFVNISNHQI